MARNECGLAIGRMLRRTGLIVSIFIAPVYLALPAKAGELDGAWSTRADECSNIFVKRGDQLYLSERADFYGSGFVITGNIIRGKIATCKINSMKKSGTTVHLRTTCATDIMISNVAFDLKIVDANKVIRAVPGIPEMDTPYARCPAN